MAKEMTHAEYNAKQCVKNVQRVWGHNCRERLGQVIYEALVAREAVSIVMAQAAYVSKDATVEHKAHCGEYMQEVCTLAMRYADPNCA